MERLTRIANKYETDKGTVNGDKHGYTEFYQRFFERYENPKILEIGTYYGGSVRMMNDFYDRDCEIWTCDICDEFGNMVSDLPNVHFIHVDLGDEDSFKNMCKQLEGIEFDIIIDDATHIWQHQMSLLVALHGLLKENGIYVIEDIHYSRLYDDLEDSPLFFINFLVPNIMLTEEENIELISKIKDVEIFSRKNLEGNMNKYGGRSMTAILTFDK